MKTLITILTCLLFCSCTKELDIIEDALKNIRKDQSSNVGIDTAHSKLYVQLLLNLDGGPSNTADGVSCVFDNKYSYEISDEDSEKMTNFDENIAIVKDKLLSITGQPYPQTTDTIFLKIWNFKQDSYYLQLVPESFPENIKIFLCDKAGNTQKEISGKYNHYFTVKTGEEVDPGFYLLVRRDY